MKFWRWQGRSVERSEIERAAKQASDKIGEWQKRANKAASRLARSRGRDRAAEREGQLAERQLSAWGGKARAAMNALAKGDKRKREREQPAPGKWRYWVRVSYGVANNGRVIEVYFNERKGKRLTDAEAVQVVYDLVLQQRRPDIAWNRVMYGKRSPDARLTNRSEIGNFAALVLSGDVEEIGEEQVS